MVAFFAIATSMLLALPSVLAEPMSIPHLLNPRQVGGFDPTKIPTSCLQDKCKALGDAVTSSHCTNLLSCLCTTDMANNFKSCLQCAVDANVAGYNQTTIDQFIKDYVAGCSAAGYPVSVSSTTTKGSSAIAQMSTSILAMVFAATVGGFAFA